MGQAITQQQRYNLSSHGCCIEGQYSSHEAMKLAHIVIQCLSERPEYRPKIEEIVRSLEQLHDSNDTTGGVGSF